MYDPFFLSNGMQDEAHIPPSYRKMYECRTSYVMSFDLNGSQIKTTLTVEEKVIDEHISSFLQSTHHHRTKVIGIDIEWLPIHKPFDRDVTESHTKPAILHLCDGYSCLIINLHRNLEVPHSLLNFLRLPNYTFVGCGIKDNFVKLEKYFGIGCKNAVELGTLAASLKEDPYLSFCGVDELASMICDLDLRKYRPINLAFNWGSYPLRKELAKLATVNVYSYHKIGSALLKRYRPLVSISGIDLNHN